MDGINPQECIYKINYSVNRLADENWKLKGWHPGGNFILIYDGKASMTSSGRTETVKKGDLVYFKNDIFREAYTFSDNLMKCYAIGFECLVFDRVSGEMKVVDLPFDFVEHINSDLVFDRVLTMFDEMNRIRHSEDPYKVYEQNSCFLLIVKELLRWKAVQAYDYAAEEKVQKAMTYLNNNISCKITVDEVATYIGVSPSYLSRIFKDMTGETLITYFNQLKMNMARQCLAAGASVTECAERTGFRDVYYFSKVFRQYEGLSPSSYARNMV